jgi:hypothetical protein
VDRICELSQLINELFQGSPPNDVLEGYDNIKNKARKLFMCFPELVIPDLKLKNSCECNRPNDNSIKEKIEDLQKSIFSLKHSLITSPMGGWKTSDLFPQWKSIHDGATEIWREMRKSGSVACEGDAWKNIKKEMRNILENYSRYVLPRPQNAAKIWSLESIGGDVSRPTLSPGLKIPTGRSYLPL